MRLFGGSGGEADRPTSSLRRPPSTGDELDRLLATGKAAPSAGWATAKVRMWQCPAVRVGGGVCALMAAEVCAGRELGAS